MPDQWRSVEVMNVKLFRVSNDFMLNQCYLVYKENAGILIDPAWNYELIENFIEENKIVLKGVLLTHAHADHTDLADAFSSAYGVPVYMLALEIEAFDFQCKNLRGVWHQEKIILHNFDILPIHTPGHTRGSVCYYIENHLFTGDTVFIEGVGICNQDNVDDLYNSVQFLKNFLPSATLIWPGHSFGEEPGKTLKHLLHNNIYFQLDQRKHFVDFRMRKNQPNRFSFK